MDEKKPDDFDHTFKTIEARPVFYKDDANFFPKNLVFRFFSKLSVIIVGFFSLLYGYICLGFRLKGRKNFRKAKKGGIIIANHIHPMDSFLLTSSFLHKRLWVTSLMSNMGLPFVGKLFRILAAVPIPETREGLRNFSLQMTQKLKKKNYVVIFPEAVLLPYADHIRPFKKGAFRFALENEVPIIPMVWTFHKPRGLFKIIKRKPCMHLNVLEPYYAKREGSKAQITQNVMNELHDTMHTFFETHTNFKYSPKK